MLDNDHMVDCKDTHDLPAVTTDTPTRAVMRFLKNMLKDR